MKNVNKKLFIIMVSVKYIIEILNKLSKLNIQEAYQGSVKKSPETIDTSSITTATLI